MRRLFAILSLILLAACAAPAQPTIDVTAVATEAVRVAMVTLTANAPTLTPTPIPPTHTPIRHTATATATNTAKPTATGTPIPTDIPIPTSTPGVLPKETIPTTWIRLEAASGEFTIFYPPSWRATKHPPATIHLLGSDRVTVEYTVDHSHNIDVQHRQVALQAYAKALIPVFQDDTKVELIDKRVWDDDVKRGYRFDLALKHKKKGYSMASCLIIYQMPEGGTLYFRYDKTFSSVLTGLDDRMITLLSQAITFGSVPTPAVTTPGENL